MKALTVAMVVLVGCGSGSSTTPQSDAGGTGGTPGTGGTGGQSVGTGGAPVVGQTPTYQDRPACPPCAHRSIQPDGEQGYHSCRTAGVTAGNSEFFVRACVMLDDQGRQTSYCDSAGNYIPACWTSESPGLVGTTFCRALPTGPASYSTHPNRLCPGVSPPGATWADGKERYCKPLKPNDVFVPTPTNCSDTVVVPNPPSGWFATEFYEVSCNGTDLPSASLPSPEYGRFYPVVEGCSEHGCRATNVYCK